MISRFDAELSTAAAGSLDRAVRALLALQKEDGHWHEVLGNKVSVDSHHLLLHAFMALPEPDETKAVTGWIKSQQSGHGGWPNFAGGPDQVSTSVVAYVALRVAGDQADDAHMRAAAARIRELGGLAACGASTRLWLALFGQWPWGDVPSVPAEVVLLPAHGPVSLHDFAVWAQSTVLSVAVLAAHRPVRPLGFGLAELGPAVVADRSQRTGSAKILAAYQRRVPGWLRRRALQRIRCWLLERQGENGCWGGIHSPTVYAVLALYLLGERADGDVLGLALAGLRTFLQRETGGHLSVRFSRAEVWDTALAVQALQASEAAVARPAVRRGIAWLVARQISAPGAWSVHRPGLAPGGWAFDDSNRYSPDTDDTAFVLRSLLSCRPGGQELDDVCGRGLHWLAGMAGRGGGWAAFDADPRVDMVRRFLSSDSVALIDPPTADVTAHVVETLAQAGPAYRRAVRAGVRWLLSAQEDDGSWYGRWGCNHLYGTAAVLTALNAVGAAATSPAVERAAAWLASCQNSDGGWGEDHRSYQYQRWRGRGESTASQTAWALIGLLATGRRGVHVDRGIAWLLQNQDSSGLWQETHFTGTGFPWDAPIRYGSYPKVFPLMALTAYLAPTGTTRQTLDTQRIDQGAGFVPPTATSRLQTGVYSNGGAHNPQADAN